MGKGTGSQAMVKFLTGIAVTLIVVVLVDARIRPVIEEVVGYQARLYAFQLVNSAMMEELAHEEIDYNKIVRISRGADGAVTAVQTDMRSVNRLKTQVADAVARKMEQPRNQSLSVPIGTLLGSSLVSGRGPEVEIKVIPLGYVQSELTNRFVAAGINQTLHQIMLGTNVQMTAVLPGFSVKTETSTNFCIAETVIVGAVPDGFTVVNGDDRSAIAKINDYQSHQD